MNVPRLIPVLTTAACLVGAAAVFIQYRELESLRRKQAELLAQEAANAGEQTDSPATGNSPVSTAPQSPPSELLQLRSQVGQLTARSHELIRVTGENEQLRARLTNKTAKEAESLVLPPDYIRQNQAQWQGMSTPENSIQSFLWAVQNHDVTNLLRVITPEAGESLLQAIGTSPEKFFEQADKLPGMRISRQEPMPDGSIKLHVEFIPGSPHPNTLTVRRIGAEWRLDNP